MPSIDNVSNEAEHVVRTDKSSGIQNRTIRRILRKKAEE
jgi:hypothetical protein